MDILGQKDLKDSYFWVSIYCNLNTYGSWYNLYILYHIFLKKNSPFKGTSEDGVTVSTLKKRGKLKSVFYKDLKVATEVPVI